MTKSIPLTRGYVALVDDEDFAQVAVFKWHAHINKGRVYARRRGSPSFVLMHRQILRAPRGVGVDHQDRNGLNNRRANLRLATAAQNSANRSKPISGLTSTFKGVTWDRKMGAWRAQFAAGGRNFHLGSFATQEAAARAYDAAATSVRANFAGLNFPTEQVDDPLLQQIAEVMGRPRASRNQWDLGEGWVDCTCALCGKPFPVARYRTKTPPRRWFCSPTCYRNRGSSG